MSKKITHEQAREILNKIYYHCKDIPRQEDLEQYFLQQERLDNELTNTMIIANSRLERLNGLELEYDKQHKLLELYKEKDKLKDFFAMGSIRAEKYKKIEKQIKELENDNT